MDSKENKFLIEAYRFAIKSMNFEVITSVIKETLENNFLKMAEAEKNVFIS